MGQKDWHNEGHILEMSDQLSECVNIIKWHWYKDITSNQLKHNK